MDLILARHGNTFGPGDKVVWAGSKNDFPLVEKGYEQADALVECLKESGTELAAVYCGPLKRTRDYAGRILKGLGLRVKPKIDVRLDEIDYGDWSGLTNSEVENEFGPEEQVLWTERSIWPKKAGWTGSEKQVIQDCASFANELAGKYDDDQAVLAVSSNGRLRYFLKLIEGELEKRIESAEFKVRTGGICRLAHWAGEWELACWNISPGPDVIL